MLPRVGNTRCGHHTGAGISRRVIEFCVASGEVLVVTTPEPTAIADAYAMIKVLGQAEPTLKLWILVNMARSRGEAERITERITILSRRFLALSGHDVDEGIRAGVATVGELAGIDRCWLIPMNDDGQWGDRGFSWHRPGDRGPDGGLKSFALGQFPWAVRIADESQ